MKLFDRDTLAGIFKGFSEGGMEFHADLVLPYRNEYQRAPMHGQFLVVQLEDEYEAVLGRVTSISSQGRLASSAGEDYGIRAVAEERAIPEDLREQYLKYQVDMRVLGVLRIVNGDLVFAPSHRRLPHVGSRVAFLTDEILREVAGHNIDDAAEIGYLALGEFIYAWGDQNLEPAPWMQVRSPLVVPRFHVLDLASRRTFVFARAGFGKSNLVKLLFTNLYKNTPMVEKRGGRKVPVGTVIFDPDGEYFWPDDKGRPGLCDVPGLQDRVIVFTPKQGPSDFYNSFVAGDIKLDVRRLRPSDVISIALSPEKQDQQNVRKLKGMNDEDWFELVDLIHKDGNGADGESVMRLLRLEKSQEAEMVAARANMTTIVRMLHDPSSQMLDMLLTSLQEGHICIIDVSQMRGAPALVLSGLILQKIFDHNQEEFTKAQPETIPVIAVVEEAQSVLGSTGSSGDGPYVTWVKEGRKYDLGAVLITQQPGSISGEILSQGDNWFAFHLLSSGDLRAVKNANAHFSDDILSSLLNEPIPGHCVFWSSVGGKSYPIPTRVLSFEGLYKVLDPDYNIPSANTAAQNLHQRFAQEVENARQSVQYEKHEEETSQVKLELAPYDDSAPDTETDPLTLYKNAAIDKFRRDTEIQNRLKQNGVPWRGVKECLKGYLPDVLDDKDNIAYHLVRKAMDVVFGEQDRVWKTENRPAKSGSGNTTWVTVVTQAKDSPNNAEPED